MIYILYEIIIETHNFFEAHLRGLLLRSAKTIFMYRINLTSIM